MLTLKIISVIFVVYILYKISFPEDYTEVDQILDEIKDDEDRKR